MTVEKNTFFYKQLQKVKICEQETLFKILRQITEQRIY